MDSKLRKAAISASIAVIALVAVIVVALDKQGNRQNLAENTQESVMTTPSADIQVQSGQIGNNLSAFLKDPAFFDEEVNQILEDAKNQADKAAEALKNGAYTYDEAADRFHLNDNQALYDGFYEVYYRFSSWLARWEV